MTQWISVYCISAWRCLENVHMWMRGRRKCLSSLMKMNWVIHWIAGLINSVWYLLQRRQVLSNIHPIQPPTHTHSFMGCAWRTNKFEPNRLACHLDYILRIVSPILDCLDAWIANQQCVGHIGHHSMMPPVVQWSLLKVHESSYTRSFCYNCAGSL